MSWKNIMYTRVIFNIHFRMYSPFLRIAQISHFFVSTYSPWI